MFNSTVTYIIAAVTIVLLLLFSLYLAIHQKRKLHHILLSVFFVANAFYLVDYLLNPIQNVLGISLRRFDDIGLSFGFLFGPLILFFVNALTQKNFHFRTQMLWHGIPFIFFLVAYSIADNIFCTYGYIILFAHLFIYYFICLHILKTHKALIKSFFSNIIPKHLSWMIFVLMAFILVTIIDLTSAILALLHLDNDTTRANLNFFSVIINFFFVTYMFYKSLGFSNEYHVQSTKKEKEKYSKSKLTEIQKEEILKTLESFFSSEKPYLNASLTISDVSKSLNVPSRDISQVINQFLNKNFYDYTNSYRINEAKRHLSNKEHPKETILEILYKSGFNSKSSFNTAFKKHSGLTPTQYKQKVLSSKNT